MKKTFFFLIISLCSLLNTSVRAAVELHSKRLTTIDGLANNTVRHMYQDSKGFIWMSTLNGLNRYDGNSFITFLPQKDKDISLADHRIKNLVEDKNGFLWISTSADQFSCYDLEKDRFVDFTGCGEFEDHYGYISIFSDEVWLWGRDQGCRRISYENGTFRSEAFNTKNGKLLSDHIQFINQNREGTVWIGTKKGLYCRNGEEIKCINDQFSFQWMCEIENKTFFLCGDGSIWKYDEKYTFEKVTTVPDVLSETQLPGEFVLDGKWIIFTTKGGFSFDPETETLEQAPRGLNLANGKATKDNYGNYWLYNKTGLLWYLDVQTKEMKELRILPQDKVGFIDSERYHIVQDSKGFIWITTYGNGLFIYDPLKGELQHIPSNKDGGSLIGSDFLQYIMQDHSGNIWVSAEYTGISILKVINEGAIRFYPEQREEDEYLNRIRLVTSTSNGDIWLGSRSGKVYVYDSTLSELKNTFNYDNNIYAICEDSTGTIWYGSRGSGLYVGNKNYTFNANDPQSIASNEIFSIFKDSKDRMWIGTFGGGLDLAIPDKDKGYIFRHFFNQTYGRQRIRTICEDTNGYIWIGTSEGVFIFEPGQLLENPQAYYSCNTANNLLTSNEIRSIRQDNKGNIWIAESGTGFSICTPGTDYNKLKFIHYGVEDGLANNMILAFVEDTKSNMWISTEYGISCFDPELKTFENYFFSDNILENVYSENCAIRIDNDNLIFGTYYGLIIIDPEQMERSSYEPVVTFTDLKLDGISVRDTPDSPLDSSLAYINMIHLKHNQNSLIIDFSTFDYSASIPPKFSYKLENYDKEWSIPSPLNFAAYKNLKPGTYNLHVKAYNAGGIWGNEAILKIIVSPPFWKTNLAFLIYLLLFLLVLYTVYRIIKNTNSLRNRIEVEKQLTEYKLVFFTNISHEFRTPLTLIRGALEKMYQHKIPKEVYPSVTLMDKSTQRMLRLINQLLEFRKMQNNKLALSLEETDIISFIYEIYVSFKDTAESKNINFSFTPQAPSYKMFIDKGNLDKVIYNLLSNAFKYTPSGGKIEVIISMDPNKQTLAITVTDSGVGIPKEKRGLLFKRFMQSNFSNNSMGIGLHLSHELVTVHKGTISYEPNPGGGSVFRVILSTDPSIYEEKDFLIPNNALLQEQVVTDKYPADSIWEEEEHMGENGVNVFPVDPPLNKRKILVIEDDNDVREFLKNELSIYFEVVAESDGMTGLERAHIYDADLIISDVIMPGYSGFEITKKLKGDFETSHIPIILLTALDAPESHLEGVGSGADAYITKPFSTKLLLTTVFKLIEQRDKLREKFSNDLSVVRPAICTNDKDKEFMDKLTQIIEEQLDNAEFTMDEFASMMALGRTIFYRKVQGITGHTPKEYVRIIRMKKAADLLASTDTTVSEVAYKVGINDPYYFSKCFKSQFGISPSGYQKNARKE